MARSFSSAEEDFALKDHKSFYEEEKLLDICKSEGGKKNEDKKINWSGGQTSLFEHLFKKVPIYFYFLYKL